MTLYEKTMASIKDVTNKALDIAKTNGEIDFSQIPDYAVEEPREKEFGDFSVNAAMLLAKQARRAEEAQQKAAPAPAAVEESEPEAAAPASDDTAVIAAIVAAISAYTGKAPEGFRVVSFKKRR